MLAAVLVAQDLLVLSQGKDPVVDQVRKKFIDIQLLQKPLPVLFQNFGRPLLALVASASAAADVVAAAAATVAGLGFLGLARWL